MVRFYKPLVITAVVMFVISCGGPNYLFVRNSKISETTLLKEYCTQRNMDSEEIRSADSLLALAQQRKQRGRDEEAYLLAEMASARYLFALSGDDLRRSQARLRDAKESKEDVEKKVSMYEQILNDIRGARNP